MIFEDSRETGSAVHTFPFGEEFGYIYYLLFHDNEVMYVGQSKNVFSRIGAHLSSGVIPFFMFRYFEVLPHEMNDIEAEEIIKYRPRYNNSIPSNNTFFNLEQMKSKYPIMRGRDIKIHRIIEDLEIKSTFGYISISDWSVIHKILERKPSTYIAK